MTSPRNDDFQDFFTQPAQQANQWGQPAPSAPAAVAPMPQPYGAETYNYGAAAGYGAGTGSALGLAAATKGARLGARFLDGLLLSVAYGVVFTISTVIDMGIMAATGTYTNEPVPFVTIIAALLICIGSFVYYPLCEAKWGASPAKMMLGMKVMDEHGQKPTFSASFVRNAWNFAGLIPVVGTVVAFICWVNIDQRGQGSHDRWADLYVVKTK